MRGSVVPVDTLYCTVEVMVVGDRNHSRVVVTGELAADMGRNLED